MIGAIADDFTGATDVASAFRRGGLRAAVFFDTMDGAPRSGAEAIVIGLKTRTADPAVAVARSLAALRDLQSLGASRFYFKYCSTFDSRPTGNIGPVADALADALGASRVVFVPASPGHGRTQYLGYLFVDDVLLSESPMRNHPLTPMRDSSIPRLLGAQTHRPVSLMPIGTVRAGTGAIRDALNAQQLDAFVPVDVLSQSDLDEIATALEHEVLATGGAGLAEALARVIRRGRPDDEAPPDDMPRGPIRSAGLVGSCSSRTLEQIAEAATVSPSYRLDAMSSQDPAKLAESALAWYDSLRPGDWAPFIYSSLPPDDLQIVQRALGTVRAAQILEAATGLVAEGLAERGVRRLIVAGGETSAAVVSALGVRGGFLGEDAAPGAPWIHTGGTDPMALLLKSGNFGEAGFLRRLLAVGTGEVAS